MTNDQAPIGGRPMRFNTIRYYSFKELRAPNDWEYGIILGPLQARIGRYQIALWWRNKDVFNRYWAPASK